MLYVDTRPDFFLFTQTHIHPSLTLPLAPSLSHAYTEHTRVHLILSAGGCLSQEKLATVANGCKHIKSHTPYNLMVFLLS